MDASESRTEAPAAPDEARIHAAADSYQGPMLAVYDWIVLGMVSRWIWRCPRRKMLAHYNRQVGGRHLDIGPGTGWFLDKCRFPAKNPSITLLDLNDVVLTTAARRISRYRPVTRTGDVFQPLDLGAAKFDSVGMNFLLHCLPGSVRQKSVVFDHVTPFLAPGARVFGSTVLGTDAEHTKASGKLLLRLNGSDVFNNTEDRRDDIAHELSARFTEVEIEQSGTVCLFSARFPGT
jgi:hypothetical protein